LDTSDRRRFKKAVQRYDLFFKYKKMAANLAAASFNTLPLRWA
jgi:hypothetical protein